MRLWRENIESVAPVSRREHPPSAARPQIGVRDGRWNCRRVSDCEEYHLVISSSWYKLSNAAFDTRSGAVRLTPLHSTRPLDLHVVCAYIPVRLLFLIRHIVKVFYLGHHNRYVSVKENVNDEAPALMSSTCSPASNNPKKEMDESRLKT